MRLLFNLLGLLVLLGGVLALGYALSLALPYLASDAASATTAAIYQKATFYGIVSIAAFGLTGLLIAFPGTFGSWFKPPMS